MAEQDPLQVGPEKSNVFIRVELEDVLIALSIQILLTEAIFTACILKD